MELFVRPGCALSHTVRIALRLKGLEYHVYPIDSLPERVRPVLPFHRVLAQTRTTPVLHDLHRTYIQSHAINEYLDEEYPEPVLLVGTARDRVQARSLIEIITTEILPLIDDRIESVPATWPADRAAGWRQHWLSRGCTVLEAMLADNPARGHFCHGDTPTLADCYLAPMVWAAEKYMLDLEPFPTIRAIQRACMALPEFAEVALEVDD
ncbi:MAG: maleylacetoacetate isomerase [Gammaproteobacteria bacterium]|nr:MAG: maleylacetoacetate isomerase [Gammaproteobacteria bacterium]